MRVSSNVYNPVRSCILSSQFTKFFDKNPNHVRPPVRRFITVNFSRYARDQDCYHIYTDGSKMNNLTAAADVGRDVSKSLRISSQASIFTAELVALNLSLDIIRRSKRKKLPSSRIRY